MATAQTLINRSLRLLGVVSAGETVSAEDTADALTALNAMLDAWRNERLMVFAIKDESLTLVAGDSSYTIGTAGDLATDRPVEIVGAYVRASGIDYNVRLLNEREWAAIPDKTATSDIPEYCYYQPTMSTGTLYVYPVPTTANVLHLLTWTPFSAYSAASDTVTLPPGYEKLITYGLALEIAPEYGVTPSALVIEGFREARAGIKRVNSRPMKAYTELPALIGGGSSNIITDQ